LISHRIKELRAEKKISQKELASQLYVSPQAISKWERNESTPNPEAIAKMAGIFEVSADYLVGRTNQRGEPPAQGEELDDMEKQLMKYVKDMTLDQKKMLLAQMRVMSEQGK